MIDLELYSEPWNGDPGENRETFIGGSDVGTILGVNPFKSPYQLYLEKTKQIERENIDDKLQVKLGHKMEQVVAELYEEETQQKVQQSNKSFRSKKYPFLIGHIDRKVVGKKKGLEIKTTSSYNRTNYAEGEVPPSHYYQCLFYMMITGMHDWDLATLRDNREFNITHVTWDEAEAENMLNTCIEFWDHVQKKEWPEPLDGSDSTTEILDKAYPNVRSKDTQLVPINSGSLSVDNYLEAKKLMKELDTQVKAFENNMKSALGTSECGILDNSYIVSWKQYERKGSIDIKALQQDNPGIDLGKYRKPSSTYRKFSIKEAKKAKEITE